MPSARWPWTRCSSACSTPRATTTGAITAVSNAETGLFRPLPGFPINGLSGRHFVKQQAKLMLPRVWFESVGRPDLNLTWLQPQRFASALWTDPGRPEVRRRASVGGGSSISAWAAGYGGRRRVGHEWMLSLKLM